MTPPFTIPDDARAFIEGQRTAHFATVDAHGRPHVVPICFWLAQDAIYTPVDEKPKRGDPGSLTRLKNLAANPRVQVLFDVYDDEDWSALQFVQLRGTATLVGDGAERGIAIMNLRRRYAQYERMALEDRPLIRVSIEHMIAWSGRAR